MYGTYVPVISFDSGIRHADIDAINEMDCNSIVGSIQTDSYAASALAAKHAYELVKQDIIDCDGKCLVTAMQHNQSSNAEERSRGFLEEFERLANSDSLTKNKCEFYTEIKPDETNNNYKLALESLAERGANIIFITACIEVDQVYDAILASENRYEGIKFIGFDSGTKYIEWLKNDDAPKLLGAIVQDSFTLGYKTVENAIKAYLNEPFEEEVYIDGIWYDALNVDELLAKGIVIEG